MKQLFLEVVKGTKHTDIAVLLFALLMTLRSVGFMPSMPEIIEYGIMATIAITTLTRNEKFDCLSIILVVYLCLNIAINNPPQYFKPWPRLGLFLTLLICVGPLAQGKQIRERRLQILNVTLWLILVLSIGSFFCRFWGINFMWNGNIGDYNSAGYFGGLFNHSMMLGPVAGTAAVFASFKTFEVERKQKKYFIIATIMCLAAVFFSASRGALICSIAGIFVTILKASQSRNRFLKISTYIILVGAITFPIWGSITDVVIQKTTNNIEMGGFTFSRDDKWNARITEFRSNPLTGIGYAAIDPNLDDVGIGGAIEPGSSWLAILSMTGIVGLILFSSIIIKAFKTCFKMRKREDALLLGLLALFTVHMMVEGYVFAAGGFLCFLLWLVIGCCYDRSYE